MYQGVNAADFEGDANMWGTMDETSFWKKGMHADKAGENQFENARLTYDVVMKKGYEELGVKNWEEFVKLADIQTESVKKITAARIAARTLGQAAEQTALQKALDRGIKGTGKDEDRNRLQIMAGLGNVTKHFMNLEEIAQKELMIADFINKKRVEKAKLANVAALKTNHSVEQIKKIMKTGIPSFVAALKNFI